MEGDSFQCEQCGKIFKTELALERHFNDGCLDLLVQQVRATERRAHAAASFEGTGAAAQSRDERGNLNQEFRDTMRHKAAVLCATKRKIRNVAPAQVDRDKEDVQILLTEAKGSILAEIALLQNSKEISAGAAAKIAAVVSSRLEWYEDIETELREEAYLKQHGVPYVPPLNA